MFIKLVRKDGFNILIDTTSVVYVKEYYDYCTVVLNYNNEDNENYIRVDNKLDEILRMLREAS